jgi:hypothetical protein
MAFEIDHDDQILAGAASLAETKVFHDIVKGLGQLPPDVRNVRFRFGEDSDGAPAVWITITVNDDLTPSNAKVADIRGIAKKVQRDLLNSDIARWPYVEIING